MTDVRRTVLLSALLALYLASGLRSALGDWLRRDAFDPLMPAARALEQRIAEGRYAEAMSIAADLDRSFPREPQVAMWLANIHHGLGDPAGEAAAWERYVEVSPAPEDACPALADAYTQAGRTVESRRAADRCAALGEDADR